MSRFSASVNQVWASAAYRSRSPFRAAALARRTHSRACSRHSLGSPGMYVTPFSCPHCSRLPTLHMSRGIDESLVGTKAHQVPNELRNTRFVELVVALNSPHMSLLGPARHLLL